MKKRKIYKKSGNDSLISVTARQLEKLSEIRGGKMTSRDYEKLKHMELVDSPVRDAIWELKQFSVETLLGVDNRLVFGRGKRIFAHFESEDDTWYHFSLAYIPRALNNRDVNEAIVRMYFVRRWRVTKRSLWAEPEDII